MTRKRLSSLLEFCIRALFFLSSSFCVPFLFGLCMYVYAAAELMVVPFVHHTCCKIESPLINVSSPRCPRRTVRSRYRRAQVSFRETKPKMANIELLLLPVRSWSVAYLAP